MKPRLRVWLQGCRDYIVRMDSDQRSLVIVLVSLVVIGGFGYAVTHSTALWGTARPAAAGTQAKSVADPAACDKLSDITTKYTCYKDYFGNVVANQGPTAALQKLDDLQSRPGYAHDYCHPLVHAIGRAAYQRYKDPEVALQYENGTCYTGYTHGVMERFMANYSDGDLADKITTMCHPDPNNPQSLKYYDCIHGIGHGVMLRFDSDIFQSLPYCDKLSSDWEKSACFNGIFMQNVVIDGDNHISKSLKADDPLYPCDIVETRMKDPCYLIQARHILEVTGRQVGPAFAWCDKAEPAFINSCYQSMGTDINGYANGNPAQVIALCSQGNPDYQGYCYGSAAGDIAYRRQRPSDADPLCRQVPARYAPDCRAGRDALAKML